MGTILVTGAAGFIGMHTAQALLAAGHEVIGVDSLNNYYDPALKKARLAQLKKHKNFRFIKLDIAKPHAMAKALANYAAKITHVIHLAAQSGVRYSLEAPRTYITSNITGMLEVLELCRNHLPNLKHLIYASSSSVYGANQETPFSTGQRTDNPLSLYGATKKSGEIIAEAYARLYNLPMTGLRFFTVYGPWGRPDMAYFKFTQAILADKPIQVFNHGDMRRDFTYIDDIVAGIIGVMDHIPAQNPRHSIYNLGNHKTERLTEMISLLEEYLGKKAITEMLPMQPGDVHETFADISSSAADFGFKPKTSLREGLKSFVSWYHSFYSK